MECSLYTVLEWDIVRIIKRWWRRRTACGLTALALTLLWLWLEAVVFQADELTATALTNPAADLDQDAIALRLLHQLLDQGFLHDDLATPLGGFVCALLAGK